jgi:hypothetical protein
MLPSDVCHVVVDLETLGRRAGCPVLELGACAEVFQDEVLSFRSHPDLQSQLGAGLVPDASTVLWWMSPELAEARHHQLEGHGKEGEAGEPVCAALLRFNAYLEEARRGRELRLWGNSARFDLGILEELYRRFHIEPGWKFWEERDLRTAFDLLGGKPETPRLTVQHTGDGDAHYELGQLLAAIDLRRFARA